MRNQLKTLGLFAVCLVMFGACVSVSGKSKLIPQVNGILLNLYGEPKEGIHVGLGDKVVTTSVGGEFTLTDIKEGEHTLYVYPEEHEFRTEQPVHVTSGTGIVTVHVRDDDNPVINPGLELLTGDEPVSWRRYIGSSGGVRFGHEQSLTVSTDAMTGNVSLLIDVDLAKVLLPEVEKIRQSWNINNTGLASSTYGWANPGETHTVSFYYKTEGDPNLRVGIERRLLEPNTAGSIVNNSYKSFPSSDNWTYGEFEFIWPHPDTHTDWFVLHFFTEYAQGGKIWIDDVKISKPEI